MATRSFGSGLLIATGSNGPVQFGTLQDVTLDFSSSIKTQYGQGQFPVAAGRGEIKASGKAKVGEVRGAFYNDLFFGSASATGTVKLAYNESGSVPGATTYTIVVTNGANFVADQGIIYTATGLPLQQVAAGSEATGKYSVDATTGTYTFDSTDASAKVKISYTYSDATAGTTQALGNPLQGVQPTFSIIVSRSYNGVGDRFKLHSCISSKLWVPTKMADFAITELDFECFADAAGETVTNYTDE